MNHVSIQKTETKNILLDTFWQDKLFQAHVHVQLINKTLQANAKNPISITCKGQKVGLVATVQQEVTVDAETIFLFEQDVQQSQQQQQQQYQVGGYTQQVQALRDTVFLALQLTSVKNALLEKIAKWIPKGVLLHGLPGTGKTFLAKYIISEAQQADPALQVIQIKASDYSSREYGVNEQKLKSLLQEAHEKRTIVLLDELDMIAPFKTQNDGAKRFVSTLLTQMDVLHKQKQICMIGITSHVSKLDASIRRQGRLEKEIEIPVPDAKMRLQIVQVLLSKYGAQVQEQVASQTHGFVAADIKALCQEAALLASKKNLSEPTGIEFKEAQTKVKPSAIREVLVEVPHVKWSDIGGQEQVKQVLKEAVEWQIKHAKAFEKMGIRPPKGILLYGPPGCSKTMMAKALATEAQLNFLAVKGPELYSKYVGDSEKAVREVFRKARAAAPSIVFFDEIDGLAVERSSDGSTSGVGDRVLSQLLNELDGMNKLEGVTVIAATNRPDLLDAALLRPGRIDRMIYVQPPDALARKQILNIYLGKLDKSVWDSASMDTLKLAQATDGFTGAEITAICREAAYLALQQNMQAPVLTQAHFEQACASVKPRLTATTIQFYQNFASKK